MSRFHQHWITDENGNPKEATLEQWAVWFGAESRIVASTHLPRGIHVSTVFLGLDHSFSETGPPVLWETMIFGGKHNDYQDRYSSKKAAQEGHLHAVRVAMGLEDPA